MKILLSLLGLSIATSSLAIITIDVLQNFNPNIPDLNHSLLDLLIGLSLVFLANLIFYVNNSFAITLFVLFHVISPVENKNMWMLLIAIGISYVALTSINISNISRELKQ